MRFLMEIESERPPPPTKMGVMSPMKQEDGRRRTKSL
jgi:hypothetical protein